MLFRSVSIYVLAFLSWVVGIWVIARESPAVCYEVLAGEQIAKLLCLACFLLLPTTMERPEVTGSGFFPWLTRLIYRLDSPDNLLPSIHCLESWICWAGLRTNRKLPGALRWGSLVFAVLICISTLATRQHVIADVIAGVALAEGMVQLARAKNFGERFRRWFTALDSALLGKRNIV